MTSEQRTRFSALIERALAAERRAWDEQRRAARADQLALTGPLKAQAAHARLAEIHRRNVVTHRSTAELHRQLVRRYLREQAEADVQNRGRVLVEITSAVLGVPSVALVLRGGAHVQAASAASDGVARAASDVELVQGEGPLLEAAASGAVVPAGEAVWRLRWPGYAQQMAGLGVHSVTAVPLHHGSWTFGALGLYDPPETLDSAPTLLGMSEVFFDLVAGGTSGGTVGPDSPGEDPIPLLEQAAGIVAVRNHTDLDAARALIRGRAFAEGVGTAAISQRIIRRELDLTL